MLQDRKVTYLEPEVTFTLGSYVAEYMERYSAEQRRGKRKIAVSESEFGEYDEFADTLPEQMSSAQYALGRPGVHIKTGYSACF